MAKKTKSAAVKAKAGVITSDALTETMERIENLKKEEALSRATWMANAVQSTYFELGGILLKIQTEKWWEDDAESFNEFVTARYNFKPRKAYYLMSIYQKLVESGVGGEDIDGIDWTKLAIVAQYLTPENVQEWLERARTLSYRELQQAAQESSEVTEKGKAPPKDKSKNMSFKFHAEQYDTVEAAIEKAKKEAETEFPSVAMESICIAYLAGGKAPKKQKTKSFEDLMKEAGYEKTLEFFGEIWPTIELTAEIPEDL